MKYLIYLIIILILLAAAFVAYRKYSDSSLEAPQYTIISTHNGYEIREYGDMNVITAPMSTFSRSEMNQGFMPLFRFISTNDIKMTVPVIVQLGNDATMSFILPKETDIKADFVNVPGVTIETLSGGTWAVRTFSGDPSTEDIMSETAALISDLERDGISYTGATRSATYDGPFIPGPLRRNEVWVEIE